MLDKEEAEMKEEEEKKKQAGGSFRDAGEIGRAHV